MARTKEEIKNDITVAFMKNAAIAKRFQFEKGREFDKVFSKVSILNILFEVFAGVAFIIETLLDSHKAEVEGRIEAIKPHRPKWYRDKVMSFMKDMALVEDTDYYNTAGMSDEAIEKAKVVKNAVVVERDDASILTIKVRGMEGKLDDTTERQLIEYIDEIRDAGVKYSLVNTDPDVFNCELDIYYNPLLLPETIKTACEAAIHDYIKNLPFNGQFSNMGLIDRLQVLEGVNIAELISSSSRSSQSGVAYPINAYCVPEAGWFTPGSITLNMKAHE